MMIAEEIRREMAECGRQLVSIREAAQRLGLDHKTIRARCRSGELALYGTARAHRVRWADVLACFTVRPAGSRSPIAHLPTRPVARRRRAGGRFTRLAGEARG
jgi:hypothetical protein